MAKITWTFESAVAGTITHEYILSEADMARVMNLLQSDRPQLSAADAVKASLVGEAQRIEDRVRNREGNIAAQAARDGVAGLG